MKAMILAAGIGSRLLPLTNDKPKALIEIGGMTMLEMTIRYLKRNGITEFIINVHHFADQIVEYLSLNRGFGMKYRISDEREELLNTGGAIVKAREYLEQENDFVLSGVDVLTGMDLQAMIGHHRREDALVTLAVKDRPTSRSLLFSPEMHLLGWRNNANGELRGNQIDSSSIALGFSAIHVINQKLFRLITESGAFSIIELYLRLCSHQKIIGFRHDDTPWIEFGRADRISDQEKSKDFMTLRDLL
jgi:NDP-sugar pyrophosphorylase family protein